MFIVAGEVDCCLIVAHDDAAGGVAPGHDGVLVEDSVVLPLEGDCKSDGCPRVYKRLALCFFTHRDLCPAVIVKVKAEGHHVGLIVHVTFAGLIDQVQLGVVQALVLKQAASQRQTSGAVCADRWIT